MFEGGPFEPNPNMIHRAYLRHLLDSRQQRVLPTVKCAPRHGGRGGIMDQGIGVDSAPSASNRVEGVLTFNPFR